MPADLQTVTQAEEVCAVVSPSIAKQHHNRTPTYTKPHQNQQKLLQALECSARVIDQLATIGAADPLQTSKDAQCFLLLLKESHSLAASMAAKYATNTPQQHDTYADQLESHMLASRLDVLRQQLAVATQGRFEGMDMDG